MRGRPRQNGCARGGGEAMAMDTEFDGSQVRALVFDVFGTVVDWRASIVREGELLGRARGLMVDWPAFADAWRAGYAPAMDATRGGDWVKLDVLHRRILDTLVPRFGLQSLTEAELDHLNLAWHRLLPWPDAVAGLNRLRCRAMIGTLSNGHLALLVAMAKNAGLPWDFVLSAELAAAYKPDPAVYRMALRLLADEPAQLMMVAAHPSDLRAAAACGLRTAYVHRPLEFGADRPFEPAPAGDFDLVATDFLDLARQLGA